MRTWLSPVWNQPQHPHVRRVTSQNRIAKGHTYSFSFEFPSSAETDDVPDQVKHVRCQKNQVRQQNWGVVGHFPNGLRALKITQNFFRLYTIAIKHHVNQWNRTSWPNNLYISVWLTTKLVQLGQKSNSLLTSEHLICCSISGGGIHFVRISRLYLVSPDTLFQQEGNGMEHFARLPIPSWVSPSMLFCSGMRGNGMGNEAILPDFPCLHDSPQIYMLFCFPPPNGTAFADTHTTLIAPSALNPNNECPTYARLVFRSRRAPVVLNRHLRQPSKIVNGQFCFAGKGSLN